MKPIKYILLALMAISFSTSINSQNVLIANGSLNPNQPVYSGGTIITVPYSMTFTMLTGQTKKINIKFNNSLLDFVTSDLPAQSNNMFHQNSPAVPGFQVTFETNPFSTSDNNYNFAADFTLSFQVKTATCVTVIDNIIAELSTACSATCPPDVQIVTTPVTLLNSNSGPTLGMTLEMGDECNIAVYKISSFGLDINSSTQNSTLKLTLPPGVTLLNVYNSSGNAVLYSGSNPYTWPRSGINSENQQYHYIVVKFNASIPCPRTIKVDFSSYNVCDQSPANAPQLTRAACCFAPPANQTCVNGVCISKILLKTPFRYFPTPDNCKTHDYIIKVDNPTANTLSNFNITDVLPVVAGAPDAIKVEKVQVKLSSIFSGSAFSFTAFPTALLPTPPAAGLTAGQTWSTNNNLGLGSNSTPVVSINGTITFPKYSSLIITITHRLQDPVSAGAIYDNKATVSFQVGSTPYTGTVHCKSKKDEFAPAISLIKKVRNVTDLTPFSHAVSAGPNDLLEYEIRIRNYGMANVNANLADIFTEVPAVSNIGSIAFSPVTGSSQYSTADLAAIQSSLTTNPTGFSCTNMLVKAAPCPGYSELVITYKVKVKAAVVCESVYTNTAKVSWLWNGTPYIKLDAASINVDLFKNLQYKLEATCSDPATTVNPQWVTGYINATPGKPIWYRASLRNNSSYTVSGLQMMVQLPNQPTLTSTHGSVSLVSSAPAPAGTNLHPDYVSGGIVMADIGTVTSPGIITSNTATNNYLSQCAAPVSNAFGRTAVYRTVDVGSGATASFIYKVVAPSNILGSQYITAMGVSRSCGSSCPMVRTTNLTLTIGKCNECGCATDCDLITFDSKIERLPAGGNNFKVTLSNILSNTNTINNFDVVIHQPYQDAVISPAPYNKLMVPYTLGATITTAPASLVQVPSAPGSRYYRITNTAWSVPINFGSVSFNISATLPANPDNLVFPVNVVFRDKKNSCTICEKTIYLHYYTWDDLMQSQMLVGGQEDPVEISLNSERKRLQKSPLGAKIEQWYADIKKNDGISKIIQAHTLEVIALIKVSRKLIEQNGTLDEKDYEIIEKGMRMIDKEAAPAPDGLIDETLQRLKTALGKKWSNLMEALLKR